MEYFRFLNILKVLYKKRPNQTAKNSSKAIIKSASMQCKLSNDICFILKAIMLYLYN